VLFLLVWCGFLFFYGLTAGDLWRTENLRAIIGAEFLRSGNWIVPTLYGEPLFTKPPGMYAAIALASWPFGEVTTWSARLPSALAGSCTVFLVWWYFRSQLGRLGGLVAAAILPVSFMWLDKVPSAEIDMLQVFWVTAAILFFLRALDAQEASATVWSGRVVLHDLGRLQVLDSSTDRTAVPSARAPVIWPWWLAAMLCLAGGVLTKWTAPAFFYGTAVPLLWRRRQLRLLGSRHHLVGLALASGLCLGWAAAAVAVSGWDVFSETVAREALQRLSPSHHQAAHRLMKPGHEPPLYPWLEVAVHPLRVLAVTLPWSVFALMALRPGFGQQWDERGRRLLQALHCWAWPNLVFWSLLPEHALRHSFPLFPAISGLAAMVWLAWLQRAASRGRDYKPVPRERAWAAQPLCAGAVGLLRQRPGRVLVGILAVWLVAKLAFVHAVVPGRNANRQPRARGEQLAAVVPAGKTLYLFRLKDEGIMFYYRRPVIRLAGPEELPSSAEPLYCIVTEDEWQRWPGDRRAEAVLHMHDEQDEPIVVIRMNNDERGMKNGE
jgi:4-amino-4-deoxy-L-arabinose transferase-like glycosyltransferase